MKFVCKLEDEREREKRETMKETESKHNKLTISVSIKGVISSSLKVSSIHSLPQQGLTEDAGLEGVACLDGGDPGVVRRRPFPPFARITSGRRCSWHQRDLFPFPLQCSLGAAGLLLYFSVSLSLSLLFHASFADMPR